MNANEIIHVLDTVSFVYENDIMKGVVWIIQADSITFRVGNSFYRVPRFMAEQETVLIQKFNREALIASIIEMAVA